MENEYIVTPAVKWCVVRILHSGHDYNVCDARWVKPYWVIIAVRVTILCGRALSSEALDGHCCW